MLVSISLTTDLLLLKPTKIVLLLPTHVYGHKETRNFMLERAMLALNFIPMHKTYSTIQSVSLQEIFNPEIYSMKM
ncbi:hypothetical protein D3C73_1189470 [compost metagenome]